MKKSIFIIFVSMYSALIMGSAIASQHATKLPSATTPTSQHFITSGDEEDSYNDEDDHEDDADDEEEEDDLDDNDHEEYDSYENYTHSDHRSDYENQEQDLNNTSDYE